MKINWFDLYCLTYRRKDKNSSYSDGSRPETVFSSKEEAEAEAAKLNEEKTDYIFSWGGHYYYAVESLDDRVDRIRDSGFESGYGAGYDDARPYE